MCAIKRKEQGLQEDYFIQRVAARVAAPPGLRPFLTGSSNDQKQIYNERELRIARTWNILIPSAGNMHLLLQIKKTLGPHHSRHEHKKKGDRHALLAPE
jgi:hypothetical protein